ncbi:MAG TPA: SRPBCC family protein [Kofleriaceae bacterium]|jgi:hypothetical protein
MTANRSLLTAAALGLGLAGCAVSAPPAATLRSPATPSLQVYETAPTTTEGEALLAVDPDTAYRTVSDYNRWPAVFPTVARVEITRQTGADDRVTFIAPDGHRDNLHFHNRPDLRTIWFEDTGGHADVWAQTTFMPGTAPGTTRVHTRLYAKVHGLATLVVSSGDVRSMRQHRVASDLAQLSAHFGAVAAR